MSWISVPNEPVVAFSGKPLRSQKMTQDLELIFKEMSCPAVGCPERFTIVERWQEHIAECHPAESLSMTGIPEMEDRTVSRLILDLLIVFQKGDPNPLRKLQRANDGYHASEVWRRAWLAWTNHAADIRFKKEGYEWLRGLLDRKVPISSNVAEAKQRREEGEEPQTIASYLFGLSEDSVRQAVTTLSERRRRDEEIPLDDREPEQVESR